MGRQVNFYMLGEDEKEFVDFVLSQPNVVMLGEPCLEKTPRIIKWLPREYSPTLWRDVYFWNTLFPFEARFMEIQESPSQGMYGFDNSDAPVIEFMRCMLRKKGGQIPYPVNAIDITQLSNDYTLGWGRIWAEMYRLEDDRLVYKGDEFVKWYERIARWIRRRYKKINGRYVGPQAYQWHLSGGRLSVSV